jgi:hypothetical protein
MAETPLAKKLLLKPGQRVAIVQAPEGFRAALGPLPEGITVAETLEGPFDLALVFVREKVAVDRLVPLAIAALKPGGVLWLAYPKKSGKLKADITRDVGWEGVYAMGWRPVTQIALDEVWSALRFRPEVEVKATRR